MTSSFSYNSSECKESNFVNTYGITTCIAYQCKHVVYNTYGITTCIAYQCKHVVYIQELTKHINDFIL